MGDGWVEHFREVGILAAILVAGVIVSAKTFRCARRVEQAATGFLTLFSARAHYSSSGSRILYFLCGCLCSNSFMASVFDSASILMIMYLESRLDQYSNS